MKRLSDKFGDSQYGNRPQRKRTTNLGPDRGKTSQLETEHTKYHLTPHLRGKGSEFLELFEGER